MDNFRIIYRILRALEKAMDFEEFDKALISAETLGVNENRWALIMEMLINDRYIDGATMIRGPGMYGVKLIEPRITLKGLEYLEENSLMKKAANLAKGIVELIP